MTRRGFTVAAIAMALVVAPVAAAEMKVLAEGKIRSGVHEAKGVAAVLVDGAGARVLRFSGFMVTDGPDLKVWLVKAAGVASAGDVTASEYAALGPLKASGGDQDYAIPADVDLAGYKSVVVWCEKFSVLFAAADLTAN